METLNNTLADRLNSTLKDDTVIVQSDETTKESNHTGESSSSDSVLNSDSLDLVPNCIPENENENCETKRKIEIGKQDFDNLSEMGKDEIENLPAESVEIDADHSKLPSVEKDECDVRKHTDLNTEIKDNCDSSKEENSTARESEIEENNHATSKEDDEDEFADFSEDSGSDAEYESADEGEEINADKQNLKELEDTLTEEEKEERRNTAQALKEEGNELFRFGSYKSAIRIYSRALRTCPLKYPKDRAIMYSNRGACKMRMEEYEESIRDCSKALELHPQYMKALMRRAELYEKTEKLDEALADYQKILEMDPSQHTARAACMKLPEQINERNEKLKEEMMGKLKDLGNMVLRPFGLSTNNFQMQQDPNTGGYSVNFVQNAGQK